jgi:DNA-binding Xre family transcriptional regulator
MKKYLAITAKVVGANNHVAWFADDILGVVTAKTRSDVIAKLPDLLASALLDTAKLIEPKAQSLADVNPDFLEGSEQIETCWVEAPIINPIAQAIFEAMCKNKINSNQLAKRMGISRAAVSKLTNPTRTAPYQLDTLERIAQALDMTLEPPRFIAKLEQSPIITV